MFVEETLALLIEEGLIVRRNGRWVVARSLSQVRVPPTIQLLLASRLDQLGHEERQAIECAAVEGDIFHLGSVEALTPHEARAGVADCLLALVRKELIRPHRATFAGEDAFRFRHLLIHEAAYHAVPKEVRAELHEGCSPASSGGCRRPRWTLRPPDPAMRRPRLIGTSSSAYSSFLVHCYSRAYDGSSARPRR